MYLPVDMTSDVDARLRKEAFLDDTTERKVVLVRSRTGGALTRRDGQFLGVALAEVPKENDRLVPRRQAKSIIGRGTIQGACPARSIEKSNSRAG